jgi:hypothetical protein
VRLQPLLLGSVLFAMGASAQESQHPIAQATDCIQEAARFHGVSEVVLRAIAWNESTMDPSAVRHNKNKTVDMGRMQTNSVHLPELAQYGIAPEHLFNGCVSDYVGGWMYAKKVRKHGNTWTAVGAYFSETPHLRDAYARRIHDIVYGQNNGVGR